MAFKFDIGDKGKTFHLEAESEEIIGKKIGEKVAGDEVSAQLKGCEFEITGMSDKAGFPSYNKVEGTSLKKVLLTEGFGLHKKHKKKKTSTAEPVKGLRLRRTLRGNTVSADIVQINLKLVKEGEKSLPALLGKEEKPAEKAEEKKEEVKAEEKPVEEAKVVEKKAEKPEEKPVEEAKKEEVKAEEKPAEKKE